MKTENIYSRLFKLKEKVGKISKDSKNPFFKSKYFDVNSLLENIEPLCHENNLLLLQPIIGNKVCTKIIDIESGEEVISEIELPNITDPQKLGSAITYYRRYTLQSLLGIQAEDDDANKASAKATPEDNRPWLTDKGFEYLKEQGTHKDINEALENRKMKAASAIALKELLKLKTA